MSEVELRIRIVKSLAEVPAADWNACAAGAPRRRRSYPQNNPHEDIPANPFVSHEFLSSLEQSNSVGGRTGWQPRHLLAEDAQGALLGAAPCYVKSHSRGEYVFDHGWADAFERAGGDYYPKLQVAVPFTPVTGPRLLARPGRLADAVRGGLAEALAEITPGERRSPPRTSPSSPRRNGARSASAASCSAPTSNSTGRTPATRASTISSAGLASRKRKAIRRERKDALENGITTHWLTGADLTEEVWDAFFDFYMDTGSRKWGRPYLTREFFSHRRREAWPTASCW